ncbi:MAG: hypothetical protein KJ971_04655 [Firmicutes bacterium]|nr:hypothetical protein [Bacillota bacterium]
MSKFKTNEEYFAYSKTLSVIPTEDLLSLIVQFKIKIPFYVHRFILRETMYPKVFQTKLYQTYTDELKYRLRGYKDYSIFLLEKLMSDYNLDFDAAHYKEIFFNFLFLNRNLYNLKNNFFDELEKLKYKYTVDFEKIKYLDFMSLFGMVFYEPVGYLDGVSLKILKDVLVHSCTLGDLKGLGEKYSVKVPRRINKGKLIEILAARFRLTEEESELLHAKSVLELEIYAKEKGFNISIDLKKSDMVEYLIFALNMYHQEIMKDNHDYKVPLMEELDSVQIEAIEFVANDQDIPVIEVDLEEVPVQKLPQKEAKPVEVLPTPEEEEISPVFEEEIVEEIVVSKPEVVTPEPEEIVEEKIENVVEVKPSEVKLVEKAETPIEPEKPEIKKEIEIQPLADIDFTKEEKELLDEKIDLIIKKYHKQKRRKRFFTILLISLLIIVIGFVGYSYLYYIREGVPPFGIPVFW